MTDRVRSEGQVRAPDGTSGSTDPADRLRAYLAAVLDTDLRIEHVERVEGGWSRQLRRVVARGPAGQRVFALRGEVEDSLLDTDLEREWNILRSLTGSGIPLPELHAFEGSREVLGHRFIVMDWIEGAAPNPWRRSCADRLRSWGQRGTFASDWIEDIARLHLVDPDAVRAHGVDLGVDAAAYVERELRHWIGTVRAADHHPGPLVEEACVWLERNRPEPLDLTTVVHGDLRIGNMLVEDERVVAFLDWEMAGLGDWRADLGYTLMPYHAGKLLEPIAPSANAVMHPAEFVARYLEATGRDVTESELAYFVVLGCVKMIAILCTGVDVYMGGRSSDPRMAWNAIPVPGLVDDIWGVIEGGVPW